MCTIIKTIIMQRTTIIYLKALKNNVYFFIILGLFCFFASSCGHENTQTLPVLTTNNITQIKRTTAFTGGSIPLDGGATITARGVCWSTEETPTISNFKTIDGTGTGDFNSYLSDLSQGTTYYVRAYATNSVGTSYGNTISFRTLQNGETGSFTDTRDNYTYQTITIGDQVWMAENLKFLPIVNSLTDDSDRIPYYYVYDYNGTDVNIAKATENYNTYGVLYNRTAAMDGSHSSAENPSGVQGICPCGWHIPSDAEWLELMDYIGGDLNGGKLKETGTEHWSGPNLGATNLTGFTALPGGLLTPDYSFSELRNYGYWWTASDTGYPDNWGWSILLSAYNTNITIYTHQKEFGISVRCVKD